MFSISVYKLIHLFGIFLLFSSLGGACALAMGGKDSSSDRASRLVRVLHGVALVVILFGGFGSLAKLDFVGGWPFWVWAKIVVWLLLGGSVVLIRRAGSNAGVPLVAVPLLGAFAAYLALFKP